MAQNGVIVLNPIDINSMPSVTSSPDVTDRAGRLLGEVSFGSAQHVIVDSAPAAGADVTDRTGRLLGHVTVDNSSLAVTGTFWQATQPVSGTFWQATQPVSGTVTVNAGTNLNTSALALDATLTGGSLQAKITDGTNVATVKPASTLPAATDKALVVTARDTLAVSGTFWQTTQPVSGTFWQATQPISAASLPLPSGASTSAKQPALGTAGAPSADVLTVQGTGSGTALKVDGSGVTQPVSGTVTANAGTNLNTSALATSANLTAGTAKTQVTDGTNTAAVKAASTAPAAADPALVVALSPNMGPTSNSLLPSAAATINATVVKASAGRLYKIKGYNAKASVVYLKFWNKATTPAPASDAALIVFSFALKASDQFDIDLTPVGYAFATGIGYTISTGSANTDATAVVAADIVGLNVMYA
jgi:hypothetical protein